MRKFKFHQSEIVLLRALLDSTKRFSVVRFPGKEEVLEKWLYSLLVDVLRTTYAKLAHLNFINKKNYRAKFQTQHPLWEKETKENAIQINQISIHLLNE